MSEKRFELTKINPTVNLSDTVYFIIDYENPNKEIRTLKDCVGKLNEQQELIEELHISDHMGWGRAEKFEKELKQKKIYIKRLEYKVQKFKEMNGEQQATISALKEENEQLKKQLSKYDKLKISIFNKDKGDWKWNDNNDIILNLRTGNKFYLRNSGAVEKLVDCLNEQQATITKLKEENEQLKEEIEPLKQKEEVLNKIWRTYLENHE